jgi:hypothetical protein
MKEMHRYDLANCTGNYMCIEFENTKVPVSHVDEIRVVGQLAAAHHNAASSSQRCLGLCAERRQGLVRQLVHPKRVA